MAQAWPSETRICKISFRKALCWHVKPKFFVHSLFQILISGESRISQAAGGQPLNLEITPIICKIFAQKSMKMKETGPRGGACVPSVPLDPLMLIENFSFSTFVRKTMKSPILDPSTVSRSYPLPPPPQHTQNPGFPVQDGEGGLYQPSGDRHSKSRTNLMEKTIKSGKKLFLLKTILQNSCILTVSC